MESEFKKMTYQEVQNSFMEKDIKEELERFSEQGFKAFLKEKIILDIGDERGVQVRTIDNKKELLSNTDDLINLLTGDFSSYLPIPRNLGMKNGVIKLYDTYPIEYLNRKLDNKIITKLLLNIKDAQINSLKLFLNSDTGKKPEYRVVAQYLIMLKSLSVVSKEL